MVVLDRRAVLRTGASAALAGAGAAFSAPAAHASATSAVPQPRTGTRDWRQLQNSVEGPVFRPDAANFWALNLPENHRYAEIIPEGVVCPSRPADVAASVAWARANQLTVTPRCGGHSYAGFSSTDGLLVHLSRMRAVRVDTAARTITVDAGARNTEVYAALNATDLLLPGGRCPSVGMSGLTLGGGIGFATRPFGLTCDSLISTVVATADGDLVTCDAERNADLFWACRGGAGNNFGINTSFTYRLHEVPGAVVYDFTWDRRHAGPVLRFFSDLIAVPEYTRKISAQYGIRTGTGATVYGQGLFLGERAQLESILRPLLAQAVPATRFIEQRRIWPAMDYFYVEGGGDPYGTKSIVTRRVLPSSTIERLIGMIERFEARSGASSLSVSFFAMGGQDTAVRPEATAYVHRDARAIMSMTAYWGDADFPAVRDANLAYLDALYQDMAGDLGTSAYQNFPDGQLKQWWNAYYGANYDRLVRVKEHYDPELLFRYPQGVRADPR